MIFAAILAGGSGTRMTKHSIPKQFIDLCGKPVIVHTIQKILEIDTFEYIYIAINPNYKDYLQKILETFGLANNSKIRIIEGGKERINSIENVINAIYEFNRDSNDILVLHDAVRPFITKKLMQDSISAAKTFGASVACVPAVDTMYFLNDNNEISSFPNRKEIFHGQSPDSFKIGLLLDAINKLSDEERKILTGTSQICAAKGYVVHAINGDYKNIKITTENDLIIAEAILKKEVNDESLCISK